MHKTEPGISIPPTVDHTKADQFDLFLTKVWKLDRDLLILNKRNPLKEWNELIGALIGKDADPAGRDAFEIRILPYVVRFIDEYGENKMEGVAQVVHPEVLASASVKKLLRAWATHGETDTSIISTAPEVIASWLREVRSSQPREELPQLKPKAKKKPGAKAAVSAQSAPASADLGAQLQNLLGNMDDESGSEEDTDIPQQPSKVQPLVPLGILSQQQAPIPDATPQQRVQPVPRSYAEWLMSGGLCQQQTPLSMMHPAMRQLPTVNDPFRRQTPAQMSSDVSRAAGLLVPRVFANLPQDTYCEAYNESILLMVEDWPFHDPMRLCAGLKSYFTNVPGAPGKKPTPKDGKEHKDHDGESEGGLQYRLRQELREWTSAQGTLHLVIARIFRTFNHAPGEFPYACREVDIELRRLDHKRCIIMYGRNKATEIQNRIKALEYHVPNWVKARDSALGGFRSGSTLHDATTNPNSSVDPYATY